MFNRLIAVVIAAGVACPSTLAAQDAEIEMWRLDCGTLQIDDLGAFSDTGNFAGEKRLLADSCYLIRNGDRYLLWDTGLDGDLAGKPRDTNGSKLDDRIVSQLDAINLTADDVDYVAISHYHYDHIGQLADFPTATLFEGADDWTIIKDRASVEPIYRPWLTGGATLELVAGDKDIFGDGRVVMLDLPGHTPGHHGLLVRLGSGPILLSGDQYHFNENRADRGVPTFNADRADTLASHDRIEKLAENLGATLIIQHECADIAKLPAFPESAK
ncbi:N-acyl homoserine lactonase family protein [Sphingomicrobium sp. XHP0235]|uniref:N-acyl homoserine lactonase family protein n=1 Tax=Sphingomicrobium aquimarinum TaxID=3133971 RepID=UPI0031FECB71